VAPSSALPMGALPFADHFAPFRSIDPASDDFTCIYFLIKKDRCCNNKVAKALRKVTSDIKERILSEPSFEDRSALLQQFIENCCCKRFHRKRVIDTPLARELHQKWESELRGPPSPPVRSSEDPPLAARTTTPASPRGSGVGSPVAVVAAPSKPNSRYWPRSDGPESEAAGSSLETKEGTSPREFEPIKKKHTLVDILFKALSPTKDWLTGYLYAFSRLSSPGMIKIGYTEVGVESRLRGWEYTCRYKPVLVHCVRNVPHVFRVESLVHHELLPHWRRELNCKHNRACHRQHQEWFECIVKIAAGSMERFSRWMTIAEPYDADGILKPLWQNIIRRMMRNGQEVTSQSLLDALEELQQQIEAPLPARIDKATPPSTPLAPQKSTTAATSRLAASTAGDLDKAVLTIVRNVLFLHPDQIAALLASLNLIRLVANGLV
jgi:hypothetical protein